MSSYLRPRRGKKSTAIAQLTSANPLKRGEIFFEVPDEGVGTGAGKIKMGDGTTAYEDLPYFSEGIGGTDVTIALASTGWGAETISGVVYYTQSVTVLGATANSTPIIVPVFTTDTEMEEYSKILRVETASNSFKFIASEAPSVALTVVAKSVLEATGSQTADLTAITSQVNTNTSSISTLQNNVGNVANLTTTSKVVVEAVNELNNDLSDKANFIYRAVANYTTNANGLLRIDNLPSGTKTVQVIPVMNEDINEMVLHGDGSYLEDFVYKNGEPYVSQSFFAWVLIFVM